MKILVSAKRVTDPYSKLHIGKDGELDLSDVDFKMNPFCEIAVEEALRIAENHDDDVEVIAVCLINAYANPAHERAAREIVARAHPGVAVSLSAEVNPELREYERLCTTAANAYVQPLMAGYLRRLEKGLALADLGAQSGLSPGTLS